MVRAVRATDPNPNANYRLADGSTIPNKGYNNSVGVAEEGFKRALNASATAVDRPLLSVAQIVQNGSNVVFSSQGSYVENPRTKEMPALEQKIGDCSHSGCGSPERRTSSGLGARLFTGWPRAGRKAPTRLLTLLPCEGQSTRDGDPHCVGFPVGSRCSEEGGGGRLL